MFKLYVNLFNSFRLRIIDLLNNIILNLKIIILVVLILKIFGDGLI